jgi:hypothetical protein
MNKTLKYSFKSIAGLTVCVLAFAFFNSVFGLVKNPFRDYSEKPFSAAEWRGGDAVERGRMYSDLFGNRALDGKSKDESDKRRIAVSAFVVSFTGSTKFLKINI